MDGERAPSSLERCNRAVFRRIRRAAGGDGLRARAGTISGRSSSNRRAGREAGPAAGMGPGLEAAR